MEKRKCNKKTNKVDLVEKRQNYLSCLERYRLEIINGISSGFCFKKERDAFEGVYKKEHELDFNEEFY